MAVLTRFWQVFRLMFEPVGYWGWLRRKRVEIVGLSPLPLATPPAREEEAAELEAVWGCDGGITSLVSTPVDYDATRTADAVRRLHWRKFYHRSRSALVTGEFGRFGGTGRLLWRVLSVWAPGGLFAEEDGGCDG